MIMRCPACDRKIQLREDMAGRKTRCPHCQEVFRAPTDDDELAEAVEDAAPRSRRPPEPPRRRRRQDDRDDELDDDRDELDDDRDELARRRSMPGSVIAAVSALCVMVGMELLLSLVVLVVGNLPPERLVQVFVRMGISVVVGGLILWGLVVGHRLAWQWGRVLGVIGAVLMLLVGVVSLAAGAAPGNPVARFIIAGVSLFVSGCLFTIFFSLGSRSAKAYFALRCPECRAFTSAAADFLFNKAKCKKCGEIW